MAAPPVQQEELPQLVQMIGIQVQDTPDPVARQAAEQQLDQWQKRPGFCEAVVWIMGRSDAEVPEPVRQCASASLRKAVDFHWRRTMAKFSGEEQTSSVCVQEKARVRGQLLQLLASPSALSSIFLRRVCLVVARIARFDLPGQSWPELAPALVQLTQSFAQNVELAKRGLTAMHFVLLESEANRVNRGPQTHRALCGALLPVLADVLPALPADAAGIELQCLLHKCMTRVLKATLREPGGDHAKYLAESTRVMRAVVFQRDTFGGRVAAETLDKLLKKAMKAVLEGYLKNTIEFVKAGFLEPFLGLCCQAVALPPPNPCDSSFLLLCLKLVQHTILSYDGAGGEEVVRSCFTPAYSGAFAKVLLEQYMMITEADRARWETDPEGFCFEQELDDADVDVKSEASEVFTAIIEDDNIGPIVAPSFVEHVRQSASLPPQVLSALYHGIGCGCYCLPNYIGEAEAASWVANALRDATAKETDPVVKWRATWAVGRWVNAVPPASRPVVYEALVDILATSQHPVLRLTALRAIQDYVENPDFDVAHFLFSFEKFIVSLFSLLTSCTHSDLKENGVHLISMLVALIGRTRFEPHAPRLMEILHQYWHVEEMRAASPSPPPAAAADGSPPPPDEATGAEGRVKESVISCLSSVVQVLGQVPAVHDYVCRVVLHCVNPASPDYEDLRESGLGLWYQAVRYSDTATPQLLALWGYMPGLLARDFETFESALDISQEYVLVAGQAWLQQCGAQLFECLLDVLRTKRDRGLVIVCSILSNFLLLYPQLASAAQPLLSHMLNAVAQKTECDVVQAEYLALFSRLVVMNRACAESLLASMAAESGAPGGGPVLMTQIADVLLDGFDFIGPVLQRKICALALISLLVPPSDFFASRIGAIANCAVTAVVSEEGDAAKIFSERLAEDVAVGTRSDLPEDAVEAAAVRRRRELQQTDPVASCTTREWLYRHLAQLKEAVGEAAYQQLIATIEECNRQPLGL